LQRVAKTAEKKPIQVTRGQGRDRKGVERGEDDHKVSISPLSGARKWEGKVKDDCNKFISENGLTSSHSRNDRGTLFLQSNKEKYNGKKKSRDRKASSYTGPSRESGAQRRQRLDQGGGKRGSTIRVARRLANILEERDGEETGRELNRGDDTEPIILPRTHHTG